MRPSALRRRFHLALDQVPLLSSQEDSPGPDGPSVQVKLVGLADGVGLRFEDICGRRGCRSAVPGSADDGTTPCDRHVISEVIVGSRG